MYSSGYRSSCGHSDALGVPKRTRIGALDLLQRKCASIRNTKSKQKDCRQTLRQRYRNKQLQELNNSRDYDGDSVLFCDLAFIIAVLYHCDDPPVHLTLTVYRTVAIRITLLKQRF